MVLPFDFIFISMLYIAFYSLVIKIFLSNSTFCIRVELEDYMFLHALFIFRPTYVVCLSMSKIVPLFDSIIFATLYSGSSFFLGAVSGFKTSFIFFMALLYYSFTGSSLRVKTGASRMRERSRA